MLELKNVGISLAVNDRKLVEDFSFTLHRGDKAVIIGEEGNGKSTLLKMIYNEEYIAGYCQFTGQVVRKGRLAYLPQAFPEDELDICVNEYFAEAELHMHVHVLARLGLSLDFAMSRQRIRTLSGGEKIKIQLAKIMIAEPDIILLDEPTNDIDIPTLTWLEGFINSCSQPVLYISHDETLIENTANIIIHMEQLVRKTKSKITVAYSNYKDYVKARGIAFDKQMQVAKKQRSDHKAQMEKWKQIHDRVDHEGRNIAKSDRDFIGGTLKKKMKSVKATGRRMDKQADDFLEIPQMEEAILTQFDQAVTVPYGKMILALDLNELCVERDMQAVPEFYVSEGLAFESCKNGRDSGPAPWMKQLAGTISLKIHGPQRVGIIGINGAGKSTLLKKIWEVLRERKDITAAYMPQDYAELLDYDQQVIDFLAADARKDTITKVRTYLGSMKFTHDEMLGKIGKLSGGQKAKILFLDMVLKGANVLVLDEPTRNFSPLSAPEIRKNLIGFGGTIISVSHDRKYLDEVCDRVYELTSCGIAMVK
ncbi:MAG: ATP-binding cassette domain-containing protein [Defluviitaleaceae bacterium]|nr:ATP-binding cassette domain-containing protein [Defluviitaleaceae bacterium]